MLVVDSENIVSSIETSPDKLRAQVGEYYTNIYGTNISAIRSRKFNDGRVDYLIRQSEQNNQAIIPVKKYRIHIKGKESSFRDYGQWNEFVSQTVAIDAPFLDHNFELAVPTIRNSFNKNFHHPEYEDLTKSYPSNQLLNFNLLSYPHKDRNDAIRNIAEIRTRFDQVAPSIETIMDQFINRMANYTGSIQQIINKQYNIYDLEREESSETLEKFPYYYEKYFSTNPRSHSLYGDFISMISRNKKEKNIFQMIKNSQSLSSRSFTSGGNQINVNIHDAIDMLSSTNISHFSEKEDEIFLLSEGDLSYSETSERFVNQLRTVNFLSELRRYLIDNTRDLEDVFKNQVCKTFILGYKIEKYIDNDLGNPIQTYYTTQRSFVDTQLKYGRRYIYKTKMLMGILGSSYSYSNLEVSTEEQTNITIDSVFANEKYWAHVDVELRPSFQILEFQIEDDEVAFIDKPSPIPHVAFSGQKDKGIVNFHLSPRNFSEINDELLVGDLSEDDRLVAELFSISGENSTNTDYFSGIYEIYRMDTPPNSKDEFAGNFLTTIDESLEITYPSPMERPNMVYEKYDATFTDYLIPNQKYYYAFRTKTYHGTPSQLTDPLEVELQKDSDEYKILVREYHYPMEDDHDNKKNMKRLLRIIPNIERLLFSEEESSSEWELDNGSLVSKSARNSQNKTFKIRVTSKHTGKKIDLNITFRLKGSFPLAIVPN